MYFRHLDLFSHFSSSKKIAKAKIMIKCTHALRYEVSHFKQMGKLSSVLFCVFFFFSKLCIPWERERDRTKGLFRHFKHLLAKVQVGERHHKDFFVLAVLRCCSSV